MAGPVLETPLDRDYRDGRWAALLEPGHLAPMVTLSLGIALTAFSTFFVATALPSAIVDLSGAALISWATSLYLVFFIAGGLSAAQIKRRLGSRRALIAATGLFALGTVLTFLAPDMATLLAGRIVQGAGEGVVAAICYALIPELFPAALVAKVFGVEAIVWAIAAFCGPLFAGALTELLSWRAAFASNLPPALLLIALVPLGVPAGGGSGERGDPLPAGRLLSSGAGILAVCLAATAPPAVAALLFALAVGLILLFFRTDRSARRTIFPPAAFDPSLALGAGLWVVFLMPLAQSAGAVFMVYGFQHLWGLGATAAGAYSATLALTWSLVAVGIANLRGFGWRLAAVRAGPVLLTLGMAAVATGIHADRFWLVVGGQATMGAGFGLVWAPLCQMLMDLSPPGQRDRTSALLPTLQSAGYALGAAVFGLVANLAGFADSTAAESLRPVLATTYGAAAALALVAVFFGFLTVNRSGR